MRTVRPSPLAAAVLAAALSLPAAARAETDFDPRDPAPGNLRFAWIHGSISAKHNTDVRVQVHRYNEHTYILRQNPAVDWEAPFLYLLLGERRALLLDAGATANPDWFPLRSTVDAVLARWADANGVALPELVVMTSSDAPAQVDGLEQFRNRPGTTVIEPTVEALTSALALEGWPGASGTLDLGGRILTVLPTPGVSETAVSVYDPYTDFLLTGTTVLPGRIVIRDFEAYDASIEKLRDFAATHPVKWVMGGQIDMSSTPGVDYRLRSNFRPAERELPLDPALLGTVRDVVKLINGREHVEVLADLIVMNGVGRGHRPYGYPVYVPDPLLARSLR
ncbi:MAG: MBL fold metallo-hydrolase [Pseudomonadales bacterium]|jgi:glyoxylase-like metal-dependent hydrolase (beta-lactamase superfamily II)|nr:MBL fold metallo-hydrolase [Pseudomonadales bacterium]